MTKSALHVTGPLIKIGLFCAFSSLVLLVLATEFGQANFRDTSTYHAVLADSSGLRENELVRVAGVDVGTVTNVELRNNTQALVTFEVDNNRPLNLGTRAIVRYKNLTGDRFLELTEGAGPDQRLRPGGTIPIAQTTPALDLDSLLSGFQPLLQGLQPDQINQLTSELITVLQGQGGTIADLFASTSSLTNTLADHDQVIGSLITNLNTVLATLNQRGPQLNDTVVRLQTLVSGLAEDRDRIGNSLDHIDNLTTSVAGLLHDTRPPLRGTLEQLGRTSEVLNRNTDIINEVLRDLPGDYARISRFGAHGSYVNIYLCSLRLKLDAPGGASFFTPWIGPNNNVDRCKLGAGE